MDLTAINTIVRAYIHRNKIILSDLNSAAEVRRVNLHWWKLQGDKQNVGDMLSPVVVDFLFRKKNVNVSGPTRRTSHLYAIGSIIDGGYQNATVWGSGLLRGKDSYWWSKLRKLDIRVVRGPLTRQALRMTPPALPDLSALREDLLGSFPSDLWN